jgi:hypothetical protein
MGMQEAIETAAKVKLVHGWILDGAGPARWGWAQLTPCKQVFLGRTLAEVATALGVEVYGETIDCTTVDQDGEFAGEEIGRVWLRLPFGGWEYYGVGSTERADKIVKAARMAEDPTATLRKLCEAAWDDWCRSRGAEVQS